MTALALDGRRPSPLFCALRASLRAALALTAGVALLALAAPDRAHAGMASKLTVGIAEQQPDFFSAPLFQRTGIHHARLLVGWNAMYTRWQREEADRWLEAARAAGVTPLVSFGRSRTNRHELPSVARFTRAFKAFHERYPWVKTFATWNEANHCGEPTCRRPERVAAFWRAIRQNCTGCRVLAAELLDAPNLASWARAFRRATSMEPKLWGLHNYLDANRFTTGYTKEMLKATRGELWLTETGGIVARNNKSRVRLPASTAHAAKATRYVFARLVRVDPRIKRVYLYHWNDQPGARTWDSALVASNGQARPAYDVLRDRLRRLRISGHLAP
jgi:hypothetical protein